MGFSKPSRGCMHSAIPCPHGCLPYHGSVLSRAQGTEEWHKTWLLWAASPQETDERKGLALLPPHWSQPYQWYQSLLSTGRRREEHYLSDLSLRGKKHQDLVIRFPQSLSSSVTLVFINKPNFLGSFPYQHQSSRRQYSKHFYTFCLIWPLQKSQEKGRITYFYR